MIDLKQALAQGEAVVGTFSGLGSTPIVEMLGHAGFDFVAIDCEHAATSPYGPDILDLVRAALLADIAPIVRVAWNDPVQILKALDSGAQGVIIPHVNTAQEAEEAVGSAHYQPRGRRSACPAVFECDYGFSDWASHFSARDPLVVALIEEYEGVQNIEEIAAVPGLGAVLVGPFDLAVSMGLTGDRMATGIAEARERIYAAAKANGVPSGDFVWDVTSCAERIKEGGQLLALSGDVVFFRQICMATVADVRLTKEQLHAEATNRQ